MRTVRDDDFYSERTQSKTLCCTRFGYDSTHTRNRLRIHIRASVRTTRRAHTLEAVAEQSRTTTTTAATVGQLQIKFGVFTRLMFIAAIEMSDGKCASKYFPLNSKIIHSNIGECDKRGFCIGTATTEFCCTKNVQTFIVLVFSCKQF